MSSQPSPSSFDDRQLAQKFVQFVMIQAQNIMYVLGRIPGPDGRGAPPNLEAAKMLIDQLEVIEVKTKGNLGKQEEGILKDALNSCRLAFVEASGGTAASMMPDRSPGFEMPEEEEHDPQGPEPAAAPQPAAEKTSSQEIPKAPADADKSSAKDDDDHKKKYFKSYG